MNIIDTWAGKITGTNVGNVFLKLDGSDDKLTGEFRLNELGIGVAISMDGRGRYLDNIFIERLWRSLKYEAVYLHEMDNGFAAKRVIGDWIRFYNTKRPHSALAPKGIPFGHGTTPNMAYGATQTRNLAA